MTVAAWPLTGRSFRALLDSAKEPLDSLNTFETDVGAPIQRRKSTAVTERWSIRVVIETAAELATFEAWWANDIAQGAVPFIWRNPVTQAARWFRMPSRFSVDFRGAGVSFITFEALQLPGVPWFGPYVLADTARVPIWVADYAGSVFGVNGAKGVAADLGALSGTYYVWQRNTDTTQAFSTETYSGDIPQTAPSGVASLVGFAP